MIKQDFVGLNKMQRGPRFESRSGLVPHPTTSPGTFGGSVWVCARNASSNGTVSSRWYLHDSEQIQGRIYLSRGKIVAGRSSGSSSRMVVESSWVRPGRAMCFFSPLWHLFHDQFRCQSHPNKHHHPGFGASIQEESRRSKCQNHSGVVTRIVTFFV